MMIRIKKDDFYNYVAENYGSDVFIKFFDKIKYAKEFMDGQICMGTTQYYRDYYESDGRGDSAESTKTTTYIMGEIFESGGIRYHIDIPELKGKEVYLTLCATAMLLCLFSFGKDEQTKRNLSTLLNNKDSGLGRYACIVRNKSKFIKAISTMTFLRCLDGFHGRPVIIQNRSYHGLVDYVDAPNDSCFQKKNDEKYITQQEYRFAFSFDVDGYTSVKKG